MFVENGRDVVLRCLRSADPAALLFGIRHARLHSGPDDRKFQLREHSRHLNEGLAHGINVALAAVDHNAAHNFQPHVLALDDVHNLTELLCAAAQSRHFGAYEGASLFGDLQEQIKILLDLRIPMLPLCDDLLLIVFASLFL